MKLAKKRDAAVLSFEIFGASRMGRRVKVEHDVRIEVLKPAEVARLSEPLCPEPDVSSPFSILPASASVALIALDEMELNVAHVRSIFCSHRCSK